MLLAYMEKISARQAKNVIAVSENCKRELIDIYNTNPNKIWLLNNFVDEHLFYPEKIIKLNKINILFSGRLEERKGLSKLLELAKTIEIIDKYRLKIATNSNVNFNLFKGLKNTTISIYHDIDLMRNFYNSGDILFFPTNYEGFSMSTLEALACGIPVIGSSFAIPEEIRHYDFVFIEESTEYNHILEKMENICNKYHNLKNYIHNSIINDFGYEQYKKKLFQLVDSSFNYI